jgi:hypothetical protein
MKEQDGCNLVKCREMLVLVLLPWKCYELLIYYYFFYHFEYISGVVTMNEIKQLELILVWVTKCMP